MEKDQEKQLNQKHFKFSIRRLSIGTASVLLGIGAASVIGTSNVHAETVETTPKESETSEVSVESETTTTEETTPVTENEIVVANEQSAVDTVVEPKQEPVVTKEPESVPAVEQPKQVPTAKEPESASGSTQSYAESIVKDPKTLPTVDHPQVDSKVEPEQTTSTNNQLQPDSIVEPEQTHPTFDQPQADSTTEESQSTSVNVDNEAIKLSGSRVATVVPKDTNITHKISFSTDKNDFTSIGSDAYLDMSKVKDGKFYLIYTIKNDGINNKYVRANFYLPILTGNEPSKHIVPKLDITSIEELTNLNADFLDHALYVTKNGDFGFDQTDAFPPSDLIPELNRIQFEGYLGAREEKHIAIPLKIDNYELIKNKTDGFGPLNFSGHVDLSTGLNGHDLPSIDSTIDFHGVTTEVKTKLMDNLKAGWVPYILTDNGTITEVTDLPTIPLDFSDIDFSNDAKIGDNSQLYFGGSYQVNPNRVFDKIKDLGYSVLIGKSSTGYAIFPLYLFDTLNQINYGSMDFTPNKNGVNSSYFLVQKIFDTEDFTTKQNGIGVWEPNDNLKDDSKVQISTWPTINTSKIITLKDTKLYTYEVTDANGTIVSSNTKDDYKPVNLTTGKYTVKYSYMIDKDHTVTKTSTITVLPAPGSNGGSVINPVTPDGTETPEVKPEISPDVNTNDNQDNNQNSGITEQHSVKNPVISRLSTGYSNAFTPQNNAAQLPQTSDNYKEATIASTVGIALVFMSATAAYALHKKTKKLI